MNRNFAARTIDVSSRVRVLGAMLLALCCILGTAAQAQDLREVIKQIKPGIVGVATYQKTGRPPVNLRGTGFVIADGLHVITNAHVVPAKLNKKRKETLVVLVGQGEEVEVRPAEMVASDPDHDVAVLRIGGTPLRALRLGDDRSVAEGQMVAFTGFPIGAVLGLYPVTHRGIISSITPIATPLPSAKGLDVQTIRRLKDRYPVFQLDATAYPGNSGSPLYDVNSARVIGIVSSVFVQSTKERILQDPSGITYAIPIRYAKALLSELGL